jgi:hypothetical protein
VSERNVLPKSRGFVVVCSLLPVVDLGLDLVAEAVREDLVLGFNLASSSAARKKKSEAVI